MRIIKVDLESDFTEVVLAALETLNGGGVIVYPSDTIYGLGANACDVRAVEQIYKIKKRSFSKPLSIIARNMLWVENLAFVPPKLRPALEQIWPGPTTVVLSKKSVLPLVLTSGQANVAIRIPDSKFVDTLLGKFGYPLTATSANLSGEEGTVDVTSIINSFGEQLWKPDLIIDAGILPKSLPLTILDLSTVIPRILRVGPTKPGELMKILGVKD